MTACLVSIKRSGQLGRQAASGWAPPGGTARQGGAVGVEAAGRCGGCQRAASLPGRDAALHRALGQRGGWRKTHSAVRWRGTCRIVQQLTSQSAAGAAIPPLTNPRTSIPRPANAARICDCSEGVGALGSALPRGSACTAAGAAAAAAIATPTVGVGGAVGEPPPSADAAIIVGRNAGPEWGACGTAAAASCAGSNAEGRWLQPCSKVAVSSGSTAQPGCPRRLQQACR